MIIYTLPPISTPLYKYIDLSMSNDIPTKKISQSVSTFMCDIKEKIHKHEADWDTYKKHTNPYEYIHTNHPHKKRPVSKYKPLSRSYFKMIEISHELSIFPFSVEFRELSYEDNITTPIRTFHLAEGPGGFIEAVANLRKNPKDVYIGMTIQDTKNDGTIPTWKKSEHFLHANPNVFIENGMDGTGDILSVANFEYCSEKYSSSMDLITADGGFDFSTDFNNQELQIARLLFAQIAFALVMQKHHGNFVLKIFDCFYECTVDLLVLLSSFYKTVYITKPKTSRFGNSEKYVVCEDFIYESSADFFPYLHSAFTYDGRPSPSTSSLKATLDIPRTPTMFIHRFLSIPTPYHFLIKLEEYNSIFGISQIENIHNTILLIERKLKPERIDQMIQSNIVKCIEWCIQYGVPYKPISQYNTFV